MTLITVQATRIRPLLGSITGAGQMGEASQIGQLVYVGSDDKLYETDATDASKVSGKLGWLVAGNQITADGSLQIDEAVTVVWFGRVAVGEGLDPSQDYYIADTPGRMADAVGTITRRTGYAESASVFFFNPDISEPTSS